MPNRRSNTFVGKARRPLDVTNYELKMGNSYDIVTTYRIEHDAMKNRNPVDEGGAVA